MPPTSAQTAPTRAAIKSRSPLIEPFDGYIFGPMTVLNIDEPMIMKIIANFMLIAEAEPFFAATAVFVTL